MQNNTECKLNNKIKKGKSRQNDENKQIEIEGKKPRQNAEKEQTF